MERTLIADLGQKIGEEVTIKGWVDVRRDQGKMVFLDFRDRSGKVQGVVLPNSLAMDNAKKLRTEFVVAVIGKINNRPEKNIKEGVLNGNIELEIFEIEILNEAETMPIDISTDGKETGEEHRLRYRYIDLKRERMQHNLKMRHKVVKLIRDRLDEQGFVEIETPILTKSTPEGARDYVVPSRLEHGHFYALPQSPQQYKQLLMVSGLERYFQLARCFRDEDTRSDRQPEFTQMDLEMSFPTQEEIIQLNEKLLIEIVQTFFPQKKIQELPFPRLTYKEAMEKYGTDRPDLRQDKNDPDLLAFCWVIDFPFFEKNDEGGWTFTHNPFSAPKPEHMEKLMKKEDVENILTTQYDVALNGYEVGGGSIRNHQPTALRTVFEIMGYPTERIEANFGHMLAALGAGAPPHGGIAWGLERFLAILLSESSIREVMAFPKTGEGKDLMMDSPDEVSEKQLIELGISIKKPLK